MSKRLNHYMREELIRHLANHFSHSACKNEFEALKAAMTEYATLAISQIKQQHAEIYSLPNCAQYLVCVKVAVDDRLNVRSYAMGSVEEQACIRETAMRFLRGFVIEPTYVPAAYLLDSMPAESPVLDLQKVNVTDDAVSRGMRIQAEIIKDTAMQIAKRVVADDERCTGLVQHSFTVRQVDKELLGTLQSRVPQEAQELFFGKTKAQLYAEKRAFYGAEVRAYGGVK